jgi:hypothetical protein
MQARQILGNRLDYALAGLLLLLLAAELGFSLARNHKQSMRRITSTPDTVTGHAVISVSRDNTGSVGRG